MAIAIAALVVIAVADLSGTDSSGHVFSDLHPDWIVVLAAAEMLTIPAYLMTYRAILGIDRRPPPLPLLVWLVVAGFGPFAMRGGFGLDHRALQQLGTEPRSARVRVLALSALEWVVLAPAACVAAIVLLISGSSARGSLLWPWAVVAPIGLAIGLWATAPERTYKWLEQGRMDGAAQAIEAIRIVHRLLRRPSSGWQAWLGTAGYWLADIAALYAACRLFGLRLDAAAVIVAYGTGYVLTRRTLPLAGAGIIEFLLTLALHWVGEPIGPALAAVIAYRVFNLVIVTAPALFAHRRLDRWMSDSADQGGGVAGAGHSRWS